MRDRREHVTGPENYQEGERFIADSLDLMVAESGKLSAYEWIALKLQCAQVHATLALAAATALSQTDDDERVVGMHESDWLAWNKVAGEPLRGMVRDGN